MIYTAPLASEDDDDDGFFEESDSLMYAYIWLLVLTVLLLIFFIILVVLCCRVRRLQRQYAQLKKTDAYAVNNAYVNTSLAATNEQRLKELNEREHQLNERERQLQRQDSVKAEWMNSMKPDQFMDYEVSTIERDASQRHRRNNAGAGAAAANSPITKSAPDLYEGTPEKDWNTGAHSTTLSREELVNY